MTDASTRCTAASDPAARSGRAALVEALARIRSGARGGHLVLLRETELGEAAVDEGDIDLLVSRSHLVTLLDRLDVLCRELEINLYVERTNSRKTRVSLYSGDLLHSLHFDLWTDLWQLDAGRRSLRWKDVAAICRSREGDFARMTLRLEVAIYLHHLHAKRKDLASSGVRARLGHYAHALAAQADGQDSLATTLAALAEDAPEALPEELLELASEVLDRELGARHRWSAPWRRIEDAARRAWARRLAPPPGVRGVALVGPDGIGKSTLGSALVAADPGLHEYVLGKSFYRRSLLFRGIYKLNRMTGQRLTQESIDEALNGAAYLVAVVRLRRRLAASTGRGLLIDRYLADFVYVGRKGDRPHFSLWSWLPRLFYVSLPVIHLTAPHAHLWERKQEISATGLERFDRDMTRFYRSLSRVRYLRFTNTGSPEAATRALGRQLAAWSPEKGA